MNESRSRLPATPRIFIVLTGAEAAALCALQPVGVDAIQALAKIRMAAEHAAAPLSPEPSAVAPLRAKHYRPRDRTPQFRQAQSKRRMAKAMLPSLSVPVPAPAPDDYVPFRDEANGIYT